MDIHANTYAEMARRKAWLSTPEGRAFAQAHFDIGLDADTCSKFGHYYDGDGINDKYGIGGRTFTCFFCAHEKTFDAECSQFN